MYTIWFEWTAPPPIRETNQPKVLHTWKHTQVYFDVYDPIWKPHRCLSLSTTGLYSEMKCLMFFTKLVFRYVLSWSFICFLRGGGNLLWDCREWSPVEQSNLGDGGHHLHSLANWPTPHPLCDTSRQIQKLRNKKILTSPPPLTAQCIYPSFPLFLIARSGQEDWCWQHCGNIDKLFESDWHINASCSWKHKHVNLLWTFRHKRF